MSSGKEGKIHIHFGDDLTGQNNCLGILSDFEGHTCLKTLSSGKR